MIIIQLLQVIKAFCKQTGICVWNILNKLQLNVSNIINAKLMLRYMRLAHIS